VVRPCGRLLVLDVLHYPAQVRSHADYAADLACPATTEAERTLARQLLALASAPLDWGRYPDRSAEELAAFAGRAAGTVRAKHGKSGLVSRPGCGPKSVR
jgi:non-homologous end joining protein Ku